MRSRFAAYALGKVGYIIQTERLAEPSSRESLRRFCEQTEFVGLQILDETEETVTFRATLLQNGRDASFTERSLFVKERGRWLYVGALPR
jgi:SEC-C motif-containing protein